MIGNSYLRELFQCPDRDASINQLLELIEHQDKDFIESLISPMELDTCSNEELQFMTIISALLDYKLQVHGVPVPAWIRDSRLCFAKPFYYTNRLSDFERVKLLYSCPAPFKARNVYFDLAGLIRV